MSGSVLNLLYKLKWSEVKVAQSCLTLWDPMDYTVHGILQARILEWVAFPFSRGSSQPRDRTQVSLIAGRFFTSWATREAQEYWSGQPIPSPGDLPKTQESDQSLLHRRQILYQLSHKNSEIGDDIGSITICILQMRKQRHRAQRSLSKVTQPVTDWRSCQSNSGHLWASSGSWWWTAKTGMLHPRGHKELDTTEPLNWGSRDQLLKHPDHRYT